MEFGLGDEQRLMVQTIRQFIQNELEPLEQLVESQGVLADEKAKEVFEKSKALGFYALNIPREYGGGGLSTLDWMLAEEQFGRTTDILVRRAFGNVYEILLAGTQSQKDRWLLPSVQGERTFSIAFTEPDAGSDAASIKTQAVKEGADWRLSGGKHFISDGLYSDFFIVTAITDPQADKKGISTFIVDKDADGLTVGRDQPMMGLRGTSHIELFFDGVALTRENLLGKEGDGLKLAYSTLGRVRLAQIGARAIGKATRILELTIDYAKERKQFGIRIGDFQMMQKLLADSAIEINSSRLALLQTAWEVDQGGERERNARTRISMVKVQAAETLGRVADRAMQVFAGMGYCKDLPIERYYRDARIYRIYDGTSEIHRGVVAKNLLAGDSAGYDIAAM